MTEKEKMLQGKIYDPSDMELMRIRHNAHLLCAKYNKLEDDNDSKRQDIINELIPQNNGVYLQGPIYFDYGCFTTFGKGCYANFNLTILDICPVNIGDNVFMGPNVSIVTPMHPFIPLERQMYKNEFGVVTDKEYGKPITIKSNCWIAANVTICGGVTIGEGTVIGAGSVVTKSIPSGVLAAGNPCKVIRALNEYDSIYLNKKLF